MFKYFLTAFLILSSYTHIYSQDSSAEQGTQVNFNGTIRFRSFGLSRDTALSRTTSPYPYSNSYTTQQQNAAAVTAMANNTAALLTGKPSTITKSKENLSYSDARILLNTDFITSKYLDGLWGVQVGDILFGDPTNQFIQNSTIPSNYQASFNSNLQTNFLYLNIKLPAQGITSKVGLQQFSSPGSKLVQTRGTGISITWSTKFLNLAWQSGYINSLDKTFANRDLDGYYQNGLTNNSIFFLRAKTMYFRNTITEVYSYYANNNVPNASDPYSETGSLFWDGLYNEFKFTNWAFTVHGIHNHGRVQSTTPIIDTTGTLTSQLQSWMQSIIPTNQLNSTTTLYPFTNGILYQKKNPHTINGGLWDLQATYFYNQKISLNFVSVGTTGRPGYEKDGTPSYYRGNGYRTLAPGFGVSNIAIDYTGGYALFTSATMFGLAEHGLYTNINLIGSLQLTLGYYQLRSNKSPQIENNQYFNSANDKKTTCYLGDEYNLNLRWNVWSDLQLIFRSGIFYAYDGLKALNDTLYGKHISEAFITAQYKF